jgi:hypothetical protein
MPVIMRDTCGFDDTNQHVVPYFKFIPHVGGESAGINRIGLGFVNLYGPIFGTQLTVGCGMALHG